MRRLGAIAVGGCLAIATTGCKKGPSAAGGTPSASAAASASSKPKPATPQPIDPATVAKAVNPKGAAPYSGPTGGVKGVVTVAGDSAPDMPDRLKGIKKKCAKATAYFKPLFHEGMGRSAPDVLVAVTGYDGYVPAKQPAVKLEARDCTWGQRTVGVTFGQRLDIFAKDGDGYLPRLVGVRSPAVHVAIPGGRAVKVHPTRPGRFLLIDTVKTFMRADVFVLKYATFDVTGQSGEYEIQGIPVGEVDLNAVMPETLQSAGRKVKIEAGKTAEVNLEIAFDKEKHTPKAAPPAPVSTIH